MKKRDFVILLLIVFEATLLRAQGMDQLVDIRPEIIRKDGSFDTGISDREQKGRKILNACYIAHGWDKKKNVKVLTAIYTDDWSVGPEQFHAFNNWPSLKQRLRHDFLSFKLGNSRIELLNGPSKGEVSGVDKNIPYEIKGERPVMASDMNMIPAYVGKEYFIQLPYWIRKVPLVNYVKDSVIGDKTYELVYGTWKSPEANTKYDQYIYWVEKKTKRLEIVQYTVRVVAPGAYGFVVFDDFREVEGVALPFKHKLGFLPTPDGLIHVMDFEAVHFDAEDAPKNMHPLGKKGSIP